MAAKYRSYIHIERLDKLDGYLNGTVTVTPKVDSTNGVIWYNEEEDKICAGSRKRKLNSQSDNAGFYNWVHSDSPEAKALKYFIIHHSELIVYGEWIPENKFIGHIKTYNKDALGTFQIFDIYDADAEKYLEDDVWRKLIEDYPELHPVPILAVLENPTEEEVLEIAKSNKYLLDYAENAGEGVVLRNPEYRDEWGHYQIAKVVLDEYRQIQGTPKAKAESKRLDCEENIVEVYVTDAELAKAKAKVCVTLELDEFDARNGKCIGYYLNLVWKDFIEENIMHILKKYKNPVINFQVLQNLCFMKARKYIGLI